MVKKTDLRTGVRRNTFLQELWLVLKIVLIFSVGMTSLLLIYILMLEI